MALSCQVGLVTCRILYHKIEELNILEVAKKKNNNIMKDIIVSRLFTLEIETSERPEWEKQSNQVAVAQWTKNVSCDCFKVTGRTLFEATV